MKKRFLLFLLAVFPLLANADESGTCGNNLTWTYVNATQTLTISGSGKMYDYYSSSSTPWGKESLTVSVLIIENGVTSIGSHAFYSQTQLASVTIPNSVTSIGSSAFDQCESLTSVNIPNSVTSIGAYTFDGYPQPSSPSVEY